MEERRDDWRNSVDARLVNLTSAQKSADIDIERLKDEQAEVDKILRGERKIKGLIDAVNHLENEVQKFNRIFLDKDYAGHPGLPAFLTYLYNQEKDRMKSTSENKGYKWAFWTAVVVAVIGLAGVVVTNKEQIEKWFPKYHMTPLDKKTEAAKRPKSHHKTTYVYRVVPSTATKEVQ